MAAETVETVGARLVLENATVFRDEVDKSTESVAALNAELAKLGATSKDTALAGASQTRTRAIQAETAATKEQAIATDGAVAASGKRKAALDAEAKSAKAAKSAHTDLANALVSAGKSPIGRAFPWMAAGAGFGVYEGIKAYTDYQKGVMQLITQAGYPMKQFQGLLSGGIQVSRQTGESLNDVANMMYRVGSARSGLHETNKELLALTKNVANLAVLGNIPQGSQTEQVARIMGAMMNAKLAGARTPSQVAAWANATVGAGDIRMSDLIGALGRGVLQSGQITGTNAYDLGSWIDLMTRFGAQGSTSGTLISHAVNMLASGTAKANAAEELIGLTPTQVADTLRTKGLGGAMKLLSKHITTQLNPLSTFQYGTTNAPGMQSAVAQLEAWRLLTPQQIAQWQAGDVAPNSLLMKDIQQAIAKAMWGGARQELPLITAFSNQDQLAAVRAQIARNSNAGQYNRDLQAAYSTPSRQIQIAWANIRADLALLGKEVTPAFVKLMKGISDLVGFLSKHKTVLDGLLAELGTFFAISGFVWAGGHAVNTYRSVGRLSSGLSRVLGRGGATGVVSAAEASVGGSTLGMARINIGEAQIMVGRGIGGTGVGGGGTFGGFTRTAGTVAAEGESAGAGLEGGLVAGAEGASSLAGPLAMAAAIAVPMAIPFVVKGIGALLSAITRPTIPNQYSSAMLNAGVITGQTLHQLTTPPGSPKWTAKPNGMVTVGGITMPYLTAVYDQQHGVGPWRIGGPLGPPAAPAAYSPGGPSPSSPHGPFGTSPFGKATMRAIYGLNDWPILASPGEIRLLRGQGDSWSTKLGGRMVPVNSTTVGTVSNISFIQTLLADQLSKIANSHQSTAVKKFEDILALHNAAAKLTQDAAKDHKDAAKKHGQAADNLKAAAKAQSDAAYAMMQAAGRITSGGLMKTVEHRQANRHSRS